MSFLMACQLSPHIQHLYQFSQPPFIVVVRNYLLRIPFLHSLSPPLPLFPLPPSLPLLSLYCPPQLYKQTVHSTVADFIPLTMHTIVLQPSQKARQAPSFNKELYVDFVAVQIKFLSFLAYIIRIYQVGPLGVTGSYCNSTVGIMSPELISIRLAWGTNSDCMIIRCIALFALLVQH